MSKRIYLLLGLLALTLPLKAATAEEQLLSFVASYQRFAMDYTQEKVYLHFDNDAYFLGEDIWFKAYVVAATNHYYTTMSKTLYVDLVAVDGNVVQSLKLPVTDGQASGSFYLKPELSAGFYEIRAYTRCMLNFDSQIVFSRVLPVFNAPAYDAATNLRQTPQMTIRRPVLPFKRPGRTRYAASDAPSTEQETAASKRREDRKKAHAAIMFYPEGGHLLAGVPNTVAFKAVGEDGDDMALNCPLVDSKGDTITTLFTLHDGMGWFSFLPEAGESYRCLTGAHGEKAESLLPASESDGILLSVNGLREKELGVTTTPVGKYIANSDSVALVIANRGHIYTFRSFPACEPQSLVYPKQSLPTGVNDVMIFDRTGRILASRMVFVVNELADPRRVRFDCDFNGGEIEPFKRVQMTFKLTEERPRDTVAVTTPFSLSIRDGYDGFANSYRTDIFSDMLLSSELKGYIHNPAAYFERNDASHRRLLDLLMLVQGWRRYDWNTMTGRKEFVLKQPIEEGILLNGQILSVIGRNPLKGLNVLMWMTSDSTSFHGNCETDEKGRFNFLFDFYGKWNLSLQVLNGNRSKNSFITVDRLYAPDLRELSYYERQIPLYHINETADKSSKYQDNTIDRSDIKIMPGDVLLKEVEVQGKVSRNNGVADVSITYDVAQEMDVLEDQAEYTYEDIKIFLTQINPNFYLRSMASDSGTSEKLYYRHAPVVFYDMRRKENTEAQGWDLPLVSEIEKMEIVEPGVSNPLIDEIPDLADRMKDVAYVLIYPYTDGHRRADDVGIRHTTLQGYNKVKEFYHVKYDRMLPKDPADHRRTLYWNPSVQPDSTGKALVQFYNNATARSICIDAEVLLPYGSMGSYDR